MERVNLGDPGTSLDDLVDRVGSGEEIDLVRDGRTVARLSAPRRLIAPENPRPFDWQAVEVMTRDMTPQTESAGAFFRRLRDEAPY